MVKKTIILLVLYFLPFYLLVFGEKNILPNLTNSQEPEPVFIGPLEPEPLEKNTRSLSRLGKKSGAGAVKKLAGSSVL